MAKHIFLLMFYSLVEASIDSGMKNHRIRYRVKVREDYIKSVKDERNKLAHGDESFSDCARNLTMSDLYGIKEEVFRYIDAVLKGMEAYYDGKQYLIHGGEL